MHSRRRPKEQKEDVPCSHWVQSCMLCRRRPRKMSHAHTRSRVACIAGGVLRSRKKMSHAHTRSRVACYAGGVLSSRRKMSHAPELHAMREAS